MSEEVQIRPEIGAELILTAPDEATLIKLVMLALAIAEGAPLYRSTAAPWQLRVTKRPEAPDAEWRTSLRHLIEAY